MKSKWFLLFLFFLHNGFANAEPTCEKLYSTQVEIGACGLGTIYAKSSQGFFSAAASLCQKKFKRPKFRTICMISACQTLNPTLKNNNLCSLPKQGRVD